MLDDESAKIRYAAWADSLVGGSGPHGAGLRGHGIEQTKFADRSIARGYCLAWEERRLLFSRSDMSAVESFRNAIDVAHTAPLVHT
jgi:hypothetical protein